MTIGRTNDKPSLAQQHWMAILLNTIGYHNPRWVINQDGMSFLLNNYAHVYRWERSLNDEKLTKEQESIRIEVDDEDNNDIIDNISERIKTRHPPKAPTLICGMLHNGGCTKAFNSRRELCEYIYGEYGEQWKRRIKSVTNSRSDCAPPPKRSRPCNACS